jgi:Flp pilus assembly protein TadG
MKQASKPKQQGQSLVEFAIILPVFILLAVVIFDFGRAVYYYSAIHNAAREGARYGVIHPDDDQGMIDTAENYAIGLGMTNLTVTAGVGNSEQVGGNDTYSVTVTVNYCFVPVTPLVEMLMTDNCSCGCNHMRLTSEAIMRTEARPSQ